MTQTPHLRSILEEMAEEHLARAERLEVPDATARERALAAEERALAASCAEVAKALDFKVSCVR